MEIVLALQFNLERMPTVREKQMQPSWVILLQKHIWAGIRKLPLMKLKDTIHQRVVY